MSNPKKTFGYSIVNQEEKLPSTQWRQSTSYFSLFKFDDSWRRFVIISFSIFSMIMITFLITLLIQNSNVVSHMFQIEKKTNKCFQNIDLYSEQSTVWVGTVGGNQTGVISDNIFLQENNINHVFSSSGFPINSVRGKLVWVSKQNEMWIPFLNDNFIEIYESTTMNYIDSISTLNSGIHVPCNNPQILSYNSVAGVNNHGQVWVGCIGSPSGWAVFDATTRQYLTFITVPSSYVGYTPSDIAVGDNITVVSLYLFPAVLLPNLLQYDNIHFLPTGITQTVGIPPIFSHIVPMNSILYVSGFQDNIVYKINFNTLEIIHAWTNFSSPWGVASDDSQNILYITEAGANHIRILSASEPYNELPFSPISSIIDTPTFIVRSYNDFLYISSIDFLPYVVVFRINEITQEPVYYRTVQTATGSFFLEPNRINCLCDLCN